MPDERSEDAAAKDAAEHEVPSAEVERAPSDQADRIFSTYGIASAVLGVIAVAAAVVATVLCLGHRSQDAERAHEAAAAAAAAQWAGVLINMNKDNVAASVQKLHDGTVGQLNADFDAAIGPFTQLVQKLQSQTTGQIESVAVESLHHAEPGDQAKPQDQPELAAISADTTTVLVIATSVSQNVGGKPQTVRWKLRLGVSDVAGKPLISRLESLR